MADPLCRISSPYPDSDGEPTTEQAKVMYANLCCLLVDLLAAVTSGAARANRAQSGQATPPPAQRTQHTTPRTAPLSEGGEMFTTFRTRVLAGYAKDPWFTNRTASKKLKLVDGLWLRNGKVLIPDADNLRLECMRLHHTTAEAGHFPSLPPLGTASAWILLRSCHPHGPATLPSSCSSTDLPRWCTLQQPAPRARLPTWPASCRTPSSGSTVHPRS